MKRHVVLVAGLGWGIGALGCNATTTATDAGVDSGYFLPPDPVSPLQACLEIAKAQADFEVACGRLAASDVGDATSGYIGAECAPALFASAEAEFQAQTLAYSAARVSCVINALVDGGNGASVSCNIGSPEIDPACGQLGWGTAAVGQACSGMYACRIGNFCQVQAGNACGVCVADAEVGDACGIAASGALCASGVCNGSECRPFASANQGCALGSAVCSLPLSCHDEGCQPPLGLDGGCGIDADCANGLTCNVFSSHCLPAPVDGGDCANQPCADGFACSTSDAGFSCAPLIAGGACVFTDGGPQCLEFEDCRDGNCVPLSQFDGGCATSADCAVGACAGGICQLLPDGAACDAPSDCQSDICDVTSSGTCVAVCGG